MVIQIYDKISSRRKKVSKKDQILIPEVGITHQEEVGDLHCLEGIPYERNLM